jgi:hypothetical protein
MDQYNSPPVPNSVVPGRIEYEHSSINNRSSHESSHLASLVHRLAETVDKQARQITRLESTIAEVKATIRNRSE